MGFYGVNGRFGGIMDLYKWCRYILLLVIDNRDLCFVVKFFGYFVILIRDNFIIYILNK